jgi:cytochrome c oxidase subunit 1
MFADAAPGTSAHRRAAPGGGTIVTDEQRPASGARHVEVPSPERYRQDDAPPREGHAAQGSAPTKVLEPRAVVLDVPLVRRTPPGSTFTRLLRTTDAKEIGLLYLVTSFGFFIIGGVMALLMRAELGRPGLQFLSAELSDEQHSPRRRR